MTRSAARSLALGRLALAALGATAAACTDTPARYTEAQFLDLIALPDSDTSDTVPPLECPASDPDCECIVPEHCPAVACTTVTACTDRRCVREAKADCTTCEAARDCTDDGDKCTVEQCSPAGECETKPLACSDDRGCTINACDPQSGCTVEDTCPSPSITLPDSATIDEGPWSQAGTFTGSTLDGETFTGTVDWGDGGAPQSLALANGKFTLNHTYAEPGSFDVAVSINDNFDRKTTVHVALTVEDLAPVVTIGDDVVEVINEGSTFDLHGTVVDPGGNDGLTGSIDFGDGSDPETLTINGSGSFIAPRHRFGEDSDDGTFDIVVSVSDKQSAVGSVDYHLTVRNVAPIVSKPLSPPPCFEGTECRLELALIEPGDDTITGTVNVGTSTAPFSVEQAEDGSKTLVLTLLYPNDGQQSVTYNLRDDDAPALVDSFVVDVRNVAPAIVPHDPVTGREGKVVTTTVTFTDPGADQLEWAATVDYGDGTPVVPAAVNKLARTVALSHTYADDGDYTASVTVSDADANDKADVAFDIGNSDPVPHLGPDQTIAEGAIWLRARVATDDGADSFTGHVSYGGGAPEDVAFDASGAYVLSHLFPQDGSFEVALTVDDEDGGSATESATVTVTNVAPTLACGPAVDVVLEGKPFARGCTVSDPGADALTATVSFGEDGVAPVPVPIVNGAIALAHTFTDKGSYSVVVTVSDDDTSVQKTIVVGVGNVLPLVDAGEPATIDEGSLFESAGVVASAVVGDTLTATVDWGDGGAVEALALDADGHFALSHRYRQDGAFTVTVEATDGDGDQGQGTVLVTVDDVVPTVDAGADVAIDEGGTVARSVTVSDPGLDDVLVATIDAGKGGPSTQVPVAADGTVPLSLVYPQDGSYTVTVSVSDGGPTPGVASFVVTVRNVAPILGALADGSADEGALVSRTVVITDPGADSFLATIDWGDGTVLGPSAVSTSSFPVSHRYADNGSFHVVVTLSDGGATPGTTGFTETVANVAPTLTPGTLVAIDEGSTWSYVGTVADAGTADTFSGEVRWITGLPFVPFSPVRGLNTVTHLFPQDGNFAVTVHVTDDDGATVTSDVTAVVRNVAPAFELGADASVDEGATFTRSVTFTDPGADAWTADVSWDDGTVQTDLPVTQATPFDISHAWRNQGSYVVRLDIYDGQTAPGDDFTVTVKNVAPSVSVGGPTTVAEGGTLIRNGTVSDPGADDVISATVDYGQGAGPLPLTLTNRGFALSHVYPSPGTFTVTVVATDDSGAHGQASFVVTVSDTAPVVDAGDDASLVEGDTLARVVTFADAGSNDWTAMVDWGEGDGPEAAPVDDLRKEVTLSHQYKEDGVYTVLVSVFDGVETGQGSFAVSVDNAAPVVSLGAAASANEGALFTRGGTFTDVGVLDVHSATVSYGDGGAAQPLTLGAGTFTLSHTWADNGIYDVTVALGDGVDVTTQHLQVTVQNVAPTVTAGTLVAVDEGGTWTFVGTIADQGSADTLSGLVRWTAAGAFEPFTATRGAINLTHAYATDGSFAVTVKVTDDDGGVGQADVSAVIRNVAPAFELGANASVAEGSTFTRAVSFTDPGADSWHADIGYGDGNASNGVVVTAGSPFNVSHAWRNEGVYTLDVGIGDGTTTTHDTALVTVTNVAPTVAAGGAAALAEGGTLTRSVTGSVDWGDGSAVQPLTISARTFDIVHTFTKNGSFTVTVAVADDASAPGQASFGVTVSNVAPVVDAGADASQVEGATFTRTASFTDAGSDTWTATVDWGDGSAVEPATVDGPTKHVSLSHQFRQDGVYSVKVKVLDGDDFGQDTVVVTVTNALPTVGLGSGASFAEGSTFTRGGTFSDPGLDDTFTGTVDWGDGSGTQALTLGSGTFTLSHAWADNGSYTITVKISDDDGTTTTTLFVAVTNVSPTLTAAGPFNVNAGSLWSTNVAFSDPGTGDTWTATVDYKDGAGVVSLGAVSGGTIALAKTYDVPGTYNVAVTVSDDELGSDTKTYVVNVANVAPTVTIVAPGTAGNPLIVNEGSVATINATYTDPGTNTDVATIRWTAAGAFEAATIDTVLHTVTATHTYDDNGAFAPTVRVTDQGSLVGSANATVTVNNVAPVVSAGANAKAIPDRHFTRTVTFTDPGNDSWTATVDWGDGAGPVTASVVGKTVPLDHTFTEDKVFTVVVKVTDDDGGFNSGSFTVDARLFDCTGVSLPAGVALWVGGGSPATAWTTPANWKDGAVPTASQAVAVCNNMTNTPSVNQSASCGSVSLGASATIAVQSGKELTVDGDLTGGAITGPGSVKLVNADAKLATSVVNLTVAGNVTLTDFVTASGNVSLTSGFLSLEGKTLDVGGDLTVAQSASAGLRMKTAGSEVDVAGTLLLTGTGQGSNLTTGAIHARGDFVQSGVGAFMSNGTAVVFDGSVAQTVTLDAATDSNFAAVTLDNTAGLTLNDSIAISGQLTLTHGTLAGADTDIAVDLTGTTLPSVAVAAVYAVAKTEIRGLISLTADYTFGVTKHTLIIREDGALTIGTRTLTLAGDLVHYTAGTAATGLIMSSSSGNVIVAGNTVFDTAAGASTTSNSGLTAGTLHLKGNLTAQDTAGRYAGASHVSPLGSAGTISIEGATDQVHTLTLPSNKGITLTNLTVVGQRTIDLGDALLALLGTFTHTGSAPATIAHCDLHARDALVTYVTFDDCRLTLDATTATTDLDNVTFKNPLTDPGGQLNISNASNSGTRTLNFSTLTFSSIQGNYIEAFQSGLGSLVINVTTSYPLYGTPKTSKTGNVTINWGSTSDDTDGDGLTDSDEWTRGTSPILTDSDGDGWADGFEVERGKNPLLASSTPLTFATTKTLTLLTGSGANKLALANLVTGDSKKEIAIGNATTSTAIVTIVGADASGNLTKIADVARNANQPNATSIASICVGNLVGSTTGTIQPEIFPLDPNPVHSLIDLPTSTWTHEDAPKDPQSNAPNMPGGTDCDIGAIDADQEMVAMVRAFSSTGSSLTLMRWTSGTAFVGGSAGSWTYAAGSAPPQWLRVGDIDGGGRKDVAVGSVYTGSAYEVYLYRSNGAQLTFNPLDAYKTLSYNAEVRGLAIANIDGDGNSGDIAVVVNETSGNTDSVYVDFRADPGGTYTRVGPIAVCNGARSLSLGDLDQNGKLDIATACETTSTITLVMQKAAGRAFTRYDFKATGIGTPVFVATDDVTGDGKADIVAIDKAANTVNVTTVTP